MRIVALVLLGLTVATALAGCNQTMSQKYGEPVVNSEKQVLATMTTQLKSAGAMAAAQGNVQGFTDFVTPQANTVGQCGGGDCTLSLANFNTVPGRTCGVSSREIRCSGVFRFYDPVIYTWDGPGQIRLQATPLNGAEPL